MSHPLLARKYARSLFAAAQDSKQIQPVEKAFAHFCDLIDVSHDLATALRHPLIPEEKRDALIREILGAESPKVFTDFVILVLTKRSFLSFREVYRQYRVMAYEAEGRALAEVATPYPLDEENRRVLIEILRTKTNKDIVLKERVDKDLLGGMWIKVGDVVWDGSLRNKLRELHDALRA